MLTEQTTKRIEQSMVLLAQLNSGSDIEVFEKSVKNIDAIQEMVDAFNQACIETEGKKENEHWRAAFTAAQNGLLMVLTAAYNLKKGNEEDGKDEQ